MRMLLSTRIAASVMVVLLVGSFAACGSSSSGSQSSVVSTTSAPSSTTSGSSSTSAALDVSSPGASSGCPSSACTAVVALVAAAPQIHAVPPNLQPPIQDAPHDLQVPAGGQCVPLVAGITGSDVCQYATGSSASAPTLVLFGDSHAWMWSTAMATVARQAGYNMDLIYKASCHLPLVDFANTPGGASNAQCAQWKQAAVDWINKSNPSLVIATTGDHAIATAAGPPMSQATYSKGLAALLAKISKAGRHIVVLGDIPELSQDGPTCLAAHESNVSACSTSTSQAVPAANQQAEADAASQSGASFVYVIPWLCTAATCPAVIGKYGVYQDQFHITSTYANSLADVLQNALGLAG